MDTRRMRSCAAVGHAAALIVCSVASNLAGAQSSNTVGGPGEITDYKRRDTPLVIKLAPDNVRAAPITLRSPARIVLVEGNVVLRRHGRVYPTLFAGDPLVRNDFLQLGENSALIMEGAGIRVRLSAKDGRWFWINLVDGK